MPERRRDEALAVLADRAAVAAADDARLPLEVAERRLPRSLVRLADLAPHPLVVGQRVQQADALRAREDEVVAGDRREPLRLLPPLARLDVERADRDRPLPHRRAQPRLVRRVDAAKQRAEVAVLDDADEPEPVSSAAGPQPRRLTPTRVVVVQTRARPAARSRPPGPASASPRSARRPTPRNANEPRRRCTRRCEQALSVFQTSNNAIPHTSHTRCAEGRIRRHFGPR